MAVTGGRNIGDEYFGAAEVMNRWDFDVVAKGPVVREVVDWLKSYWNCPAARTRLQGEQGASLGGGHSAGHAGAAGAP